MDNRTALVLAIVIVAIAGADGAFNDWSLVGQIGKLLARLIDWLAVWR